MSLEIDLSVRVALVTGVSRVLGRADGTVLALFESPYWVQRLEDEHPDLVLDRLVAEGAQG